MINAERTPTGVYVITEAKWPKGDRFTCDAAEFRTWYRAVMGVSVDRIPVPFVKLGGVA